MKRTLAVALLVTACGTSPPGIPKAFEGHGDIDRMEHYEDGSLRVVFEDKYVISRCVRPELGCNYYGIDGLFGEGWIED